MTDPLFILTVIVASVALADRASRTRVGQRVGGAVIVIVLVAVLANVGVVPSASEAPPLYDHLLSVGAPVSIFLLLLDVHLSALRRAGGLMLGAFALGATGTVIGVLVAGWATGAGRFLGEYAAPLSGMYTATYIGGGANFNALALHYDLVREGNLFAAANAVDNVVTVAWLAALLVLPGLLRRALRRPAADGSADEALSGVEAATHEHAESPPGLRDLAVLPAMALGAHWLSLRIAEWAAARGVEVPAILVLTTLALIAAQLPAVRRLNGAQVLGTYGAYLFLAVIGAYCDVAALAELGRLGLLLLAFVGLAVLVHGLFLFGAGMALRLPPEVLAVASSANVGGSTTVMPVARHLGRMDMLLPGILAGSVGNAAGTYIGFVMVRLLSG
jgi:uncharacterized membrane protein